MKKLEKVPQCKNVHFSMQCENVDEALKSAAFTANISILRRLVYNKIINLSQHVLWESFRL